MSFVNIKNEEKNLYKLLNQLRDEKLSVEMCENILSLTNAFQVTKAMLGKINKLEIEEKKEYKDVIVSMFDRRLQRDEEKNVALNIAKECGFEDELYETIKSTGSLGYQPKAGSCDRIFVIDDDKDYSGFDFSRFDSVIVLRDSIVLFNMCLPPNLDLSKCREINMKECNFADVNEIKFGGGARVSFNSAKNLPSNLDVSQCSKVVFSHCDLKERNLKFRKQSNVHLDNTRGLPFILDLSMCDFVDLSGSDFSGVDSIIFSENSTVVMDHVVKNNLPKELDFSMCKSVSLRSSDLEGVENIKFGKCKNVNMYGAKNLPKVLDFSRCGDVNLGLVEIFYTNIVFKDKGQRLKSDISDQWKGNVTYSNEEKNIKEDKKQKKGNSFSIKQLFDDLMGR